MSKPYVSLFVYGESIEHDPTGKPKIVGPMHLFTPQFIPSMYSFAVVFGLMNVPTDTEFTVRYKFISPDKSQTLIDTKDIKVNIKKDPNLSPELQGFIAALDFRNTALPQNGTYLSQVLVNGECIGEFPIIVKGREQK